MSRKEKSTWIKPRSPEESLSWKTFLAIGWTFRNHLRCSNTDLFRMDDIHNLLVKMNLQDAEPDDEPEEAEEREIRRERPSLESPNPAGPADCLTDREAEEITGRMRTAVGMRHRMNREHDEQDNLPRMASYLKDEEAFPFLKGYDMPLSAKVILAMLSSVYAESCNHGSVENLPQLFRLMGIRLEDYAAEGKSLVDYAEGKDALLNIGTKGGGKYVLWMNSKGYKAIHGVDFKDTPPEDDEAEFHNRARGFFKFGGRKGAPQGGKRREAKSEIPRLTLDDVVLDKEAMFKLNYVVKHHMMDKTTPFKILLWGPPGTGKTHTARALAGELKKPLITLDLSRVMDMYVGETEKILTAFFDRAEKEKAIIFMDEADSFFKERASTNKAWENNHVNHVLKLVETRKVSVILCTNLYEALDDALLRRIDEVIEYKLPTADERMEIWKKELRKNGLDDDSLGLETLSRIEISGGLIANAVIKANKMKVVEGEDLQVDTLFLQGLASDEIKKLGKSFAAKKICGFGG